MQWWVECTLDTQNYKEDLRNTQKAFYVHGSTNKNSNCFIRDEMIDFPKFGHIYACANYPGFCWDGHICMYKEAFWWFEK